MQFPVKNAYALTIYKAQGQTVGRLGIYLGSEVFSPAQLYTAMSRVRNSKKIKIYAPNAPKITNARFVRNIVAPGLHYD